MPVLDLMVAKACSKTSMFFWCCLMCRRWMVFKKESFKILRCIICSEKASSSSATIYARLFLLLPPDSPWFDSEARESLSCSLCTLACSSTSFFRRSQVCWKPRRSRSSILPKALVFCLASSLPSCCGNEALPMVSSLMLCFTRSIDFRLVPIPRSSCLNTVLRICRSFLSWSISPRSCSFLLSPWLRSAMTFSSRRSRSLLSLTLSCRVSSCGTCGDLYRDRFCEYSDSARFSSLSSLCRRRCSNSSLRVVASISACIRSKWSRT
mmetsp:Transcript_15426/g.33990  ORF Transcript_15426/g.33990 Transcript_15426/m.33990 type:complete len:266 (+) Transcript_15426:1239-2036(+)